MSQRNRTLKGQAKQNLDHVRSEKVIHWLCYKVTCN